MQQRPTTGRRSLPRRTTLRLTAALGATVLLATACGGDSGGDDGEVTIRFSWWGDEDRAALTEEAVAAFEEANPDITVDTDSIDFDAYFDRLSTEAAAGDEPDVITMGGAYPSEYAERGVLLDLAEVSDHLDLSTLDEGALSNGEWDGVNYGVPTGANTFSLVANPALFDEAGVDLPDDDTWDWDDYVELAEEISAETSDDIYGSEDPTQPDTLDLYTSQKTGLGLYTEDGGLNIDEGTLEDWFEMTAEMRESGATPEASLSVEQHGVSDPAQTLFGQGRAAMKFAWSNQLAAFSEGAGDDLVMLRAPGETTAEGPGQWLQASQLYTISVNSDHPEESAMLVDFLVNDPAAAEAIGADRGVSSNAEIREHLAENVEGAELMEFEFVDRMSDLVHENFVIGPTGSTESVPIMERTNEAVLFEELSPAEGAEQFVTELNDAIS
jgi:multiple sugar transport system substrate-binding protein